MATSVPLQLNKLCYNSVLLCIWAIEGIYADKVNILVHIYCVATCGFSLSLWCCRLGCTLVMSAPEMATVVVLPSWVHIGNEYPCDGNSYGVAVMVYISNECP